MRLAQTMRYMSGKGGCRRNGGKDQPPHDLALGGADFFFQRSHLVENAEGMVHDGLAFGGKPLEPVATLDDLGIQPLFEVPDPHRESGLRHPAGLGRLGKVPLARQRDEALEVSEVQHRGSFASHLAQGNGRAQVDRPRTRWYTTHHARVNTEGRPRHAAF